MARNINEISAAFADKASMAAYRKGREGFGKYDDPNSIPVGSFHHKKFMQGERFKEYVDNKFDIDKGNTFFFPPSENNDYIALRNSEGDIITSPCTSIEELEKEYNEYKANKELKESKMKNVVRLNEGQLKKIIAESVRNILKEWEKPEDWQETEFNGTYTDKDGALYMPDDDLPEDEEVKIDYEEEFSKAVNLITNSLFCEEPVIKKDNNGFSLCDIEFPELSLSLRIYCYNERTGELGARLDDEYGTNLYDYATATQGAPMGYIDKRDGEGLAKKIISDIHNIEKDREDEELNEWKIWSHDNFNSDVNANRNYFEDLKLLTHGLNNLISAMEDEGNRNDSRATKYLAKQFSDKMTELTHTWEVVKSKLEN